jgi:uncharacterized protein YbbC (DUF1343 family)
MLIPCYFLSLVCMFTLLWVNGNVKTGLDRVDEYKDIFKGRRIGIVTNHTAYNIHGQHIIDVFSQMPDVRLTALFGPEHGIHGKGSAGKVIDNQTDSILQIPIYSLYGEIQKPTSGMLADIDILVFDIQDVGTRFYTYISTLSLVMESAAENHKPIIVLDRPNPITGAIVEGNILEPGFSSFVGLHPIPVRHGMTIGEMAKMFNEEGWLKNGILADLMVIPMQNWKREMWYDQTGLRWISPSPNIPDLAVATVYPGTCLFEGTNISEGRGTYQPFLRIGAPWFDPDVLGVLCRDIRLAGISCTPVRFRPVSIPDMADQPKFIDQEIPGIEIQVTDRDHFLAYLSGISLVKKLYESGTDQFKWRASHFDRLCGTDQIRKFIVAGKSMEEIKTWLDDNIQPFYPIRAKYLLY